MPIRKERKNTCRFLTDLAKFCFFQTDQIQLSRKSPKTQRSDQIGPPDVKSNLRHVKFHVPENVHRRRRGVPAMTKKCNCIGKYC